MSIIRNRKALLITLVVLLVGSLLAFVWFLNIRNLENAQNEALNELIERIGEYDERSIVLYGTSKAKAENLAERFGAELRITSNGRFATLTLSSAQPITLRLTVHSICWVKIPAKIAGIPMKV